MQLRNKILTYFISLIAIAIVVFGFSAFQISHDSAINSALSQLQDTVNKKKEQFLKEYKKTGSFKNIHERILHSSDNRSIWLIVDDKKNIIFPAKISSIFSYSFEEFGIQKIIDSKELFHDEKVIDRQMFLWASAVNESLNYKLIYIVKPEEKYFKGRFKKLASRLLIVALLIMWVAVWLGLIVSNLITKQIKYHKDAEIRVNNANKALVEAKDIAVKANQTKTDFLSNMSHEIRTPLTSIIGFAESCLERDQSIRERSKAIKTIIHSGKHLLHIINEILDFSKVEAGMLEVESVPISIVEIIDDINQLISIMAEEKGLTFGINYSYPLPEKVISDPLRLKQILINLCSNAIKFTQQGHVYLNVSYLTDTSTLIFKVIDTGIGMSESQQENIFNPFEQADTSITRKFGGSGLGLTLSQKLAKLLNGQISVQSMAGKGSRFTFELNIIEEENTEYILDGADKKIIDKPVERQIEAPSLSGRVLVVEDNEDIQELVKLVMKKVGVELKLVGNGELAINEALGFEYDLILMDIQMPVMDGLTAMSKLKQHGYTKPVIAMTANAMKKDRETYYNAGFIDFISKPIDRYELYTHLKKHLEINSAMKSEKMMLTSDLLEDDPDLIDLIDKFISRLPGMWASIKDAFKADDEKEYLRLIHQMKGVGGGYGYPILTELCSKIEFQTESQNKEEVNYLMEEIDLIVEQILNGKDENHKISERTETK